MGVDLVEIGNLDQKGRGCGDTSSDEFEVAERREEGCATTLTVLPAAALLETQGGEQTADLVHIRALRVCGADGVDEGDSFDHRNDCIVLGEGYEGGASGIRDAVA